MKAFQFPFESVLRWRDLVAGQERDRLDQLRAEKTQLEEESAGIADTIFQSRSLLSEDAIRSSEDLLRLSAYVNALNKRQMHLQSRTSSCEEQIEAQMERCVKADRDHELLSRLRNRQRSAWTRALDNETEQTAADSHLSRLNAARTA